MKSCAVFLFVPAVEPLRGGGNLCLPSGITVNGINPCHKKAESTQHNGQGAETIIYDAGRKTFFLSAVSMGRSGPFSPFVHTGQDAEEIPAKNFYKK